MVCLFYASQGDQRQDLIASYRLTWEISCGLGRPGKTGSRRIHIALYNVGGPLPGGPGFSNISESIDTHGDHRQHQATFIGLWLDGG